MKDFIGMVGRRAGVIAPLSALLTRRDLGIGFIGALEPFFDWMESAGLSVISLLPLNDLAPLDSCPYSAISALAADPIYITLQDVFEIKHIPELRRRFDEMFESREAELCRNAEHIHFGDARALKVRMLEEAFKRFDEREYERDTRRAQEFRSFLARNRWLADYALFKTIKEDRGWESWLHWPEGLRERDPRILADYRLKRAPRIRFHQFVQWQFHLQWRAAREKAAARGILLFGDLPFGLSKESAEVWSRPEDFDLHFKMGAPPDWYSKLGQDWGLPAYRWPEMKSRGHAFWRARIRQAAELFDLFRLDHAVGFFRTWRLEKDPRLGHFDVEPEETQRERGSEFFRMALEEAGRSKPVAEDLGIIPPFVREALSLLGIPGYKVARWEKLEDELRFKHPSDYAPCSVAVSGTHDTPTLAAWWEEMPKDERSLYWDMVQGRPQATPPDAQGELPPFAAAHEAILANLYSAGSALALIQFQDVFGAKERINVPATIGDHNWTYRIPYAAEDLLSDPALVEQARMLKRLAVESGRAAKNVKHP
ncbi:MAG: 4-alpha-glucanotransferase [Elusimicrobia bacterium]|nr:4-alpha-glucanotransferase [Elusimicrobiota bacterium]